MKLKPSKNRPPIDKEKKILFRKELESLINRFSFENLSDTPDFILAEYLVDCLDSFNNNVNKRKKWYSEE